MMDTKVNHEEIKKELSKGNTVCPDLFFEEGHGKLVEYLEALCDEMGCEPPFDDAEEYLEELLELGITPTIQYLHIEDGRLEALIS